MRILIVDDQVDFLQSLTELFQLWGHEPFGVQDVSGVIRLANEFKPKVAFISLDIPGRASWALAKELLEQRWSTTFVAMTSVEDNEDRARAQLPIFQYYYRKPLDLRRVQQMLGHYSD